MASIAYALIEVSIKAASKSTFTLLTDVVVRSAAEANQRFDYIVCAHKAINQNNVPSQIEPCVDEDGTTIVLIQNGVGNEEPFRKSFPRATILSCVVCSALSKHVSSLR